MRTPLTSPRAFAQGGMKEEVVEELKRMGHKIKYPVNAVGMEAIMTHTFGRAQVIVRDPRSGVLCAGSDGRADGCAIGW
jgi:gamma-glutamyltranspeptidase/glutathione hydrolase